MREEASKKNPHLQKGKPQHLPLKQSTQYHDPDRLSQTPDKHTTGVVSRHIQGAKAAWGDMCAKQAVMWYLTMLTPSHSTVMFRLSGRLLNPGCANRARSLVVMPTAAAIAESSQIAAHVQRSRVSPVGKIAKLWLRQRDPEQGHYADNCCYQA